MSPPQARTREAEGARALSRALTDAGIRHRFETYPGGHMDRVPERYLERVLPFMSEALRHR